MAVLPNLGDTVTFVNEEDRWDTGVPLGAFFALVVAKRDEVGTCDLWVHIPGTGPMGRDCIPYGGEIKRPALGGECGAAQDVAWYWRWPGDKPTGDAKRRIVP